MPADWDPATYGDRFADVYDDWYPPGTEVDAAVAAIARLAGGGRVLELGIGTGRLALPLAARGVDVHGVDASAAMVARLRAKPGGAGIPVAVGDMAAMPVTGTFAVIVAAHNTFLNLATAADQRRCLAGAARHLSPGGALALEAFVADPEALARGSGVAVRSVEPDRVTLTATAVDAAEQRIDTSIVEITGAGIRLFPTRVRYSGPAELDDMAAAAGLALDERWGDWSGAPFTPQSDGHVSIYRHRVTGGTE